MSLRPSDEQFTAFVNDAWRPLYRTAYLLLGDHGGAEDLVQATLIKTYGAWGRIREHGAAHGYARTVLHNEARSLFRRSDWRREIASDDLPEAGYESDPAERPAALDALRLLPARQRAVVVLRFYEDLSVEQTAHALGCSPGTVKSQTSHALSKLRRLLGEGALSERTLK